MRDEEKDRRVRLGPPRLALGALSGALTGFAAPAVAEVVAAAVRPQSGPVVAVDGASIDATPAPVKDRAVRRFGTDDELVPQLGILAVPAVPALASGASAVRFRRVGTAGVLLFGIVGAAAAVSRPDASGSVDALPSVAGAVAGVLLLYVLVGRLTGVRRSPTPESMTEEAGDGLPGPERWDRRGLVLAAAENTRDTWRQWPLPRQAAKGGHTLTARATDHDGTAQTERRTRAMPDGAGGRHSVFVTVD
ncbi:hypothetical protein [Streptomyces populi]|uniref:hypothetical protein n=1 Tax=Streptomyces populi TaxID=2058924 RepID=UPI0019D0CDCE